MDLTPKVGPLVAELLSGVTALLIFYYDLYGFSFRAIDELTSGAIVVLVLLAWILGTFFDLIRNLLEWVWDCRLFTTHEIYWAFFFRGDEKRLANLQHYYWSFYLLDADMAIAIFVSLTVSILFMRTELLSWHMWPIWGLLVFGLLFAIDAGLLRHEIKVRLDEEAHSDEMPHDRVYVRLRPSRIHGVGVFAIKDIPKGTYILPEDDEDLVWIHKRMFRNLEPEERKLYDDFCIIRGDLYGCPRSFNKLTPAWYFNESSTPNVAADRVYRFHALRGIKKGEELTVNYASYSDRPNAEPDLS